MQWKRKKEIDPFLLQSSGLCPRKECDNNKENESDTCKVKKNGNDEM